MDCRDDVNSDWTGWLEKKKATRSLFNEIAEKSSEKQDLIHPEAKRFIDQYFEYVSNHHVNFTTTTHRRFVQSKAASYLVSVGSAIPKKKSLKSKNWTLNYREIEESRRKVETQTLGVSAEIDFDAEIKKANEKMKE